MTFSISKTRELCDAATEGPWAWVPRGDLLGGSKKAVIADLDYDGMWIDSSGPDAAFIAHARTALPQALDEIERLKAGLEEIVCWFGEAPHTFPDWKTTADALATMAQNVLDGHEALSTEESRDATAFLSRHKEGETTRLQRSVPTQGQPTSSSRPDADQGGGG